MATTQHAVPARKVIAALDAIIAEGIDREVNDPLMAFETPDSPVVWSSLRRRAAFTLEATGWSLAEISRFAPADTLDILFPN